MLACLASLVAACAGRPAPPAPTLVAGPVTDAPHPESDTRGPESDHASALGKLLTAPWGTRLDKRRTLALPLPDAPAWTHVKYWGVTTLGGWRYGDDHHVAIAAFSFAPPAVPATVDSCAARFASWGTSKAKQFDVEVGDARVDDIAWQDARAKIFVLDARRRSLLGTKEYAAAYAVYPAWNDACLVIGFAVPESDAEDAARALRDRLVRDALPALTVKKNAGALALEAKSDVE